MCKDWCQSIVKEIHSSLFVMTARDLRQNLRRGLSICCAVVSPKWKVVRHLHIRIGELAVVLQAQVFLSEA